MLGSFRNFRDQQLSRFVEIEYGAEVRELQKNAGMRREDAVANVKLRLFGPK